MYLQIIKDLPLTVKFLTTEERTRLDAAVDLYNTTLTTNAQALYNKQTPRERKRYAIYIYNPTISAYRESIKAYNADPVGSWWKMAEQWAKMRSGGVYKSSLLHRILKGKAPLPHPPPCSYSYPWYDIVEDVVPHTLTDVSLGGVRSLGSMMNGLSGAKSNAPKALKDKGIHAILIHQTSYAIVDANQAGIDLLLTIADMFDTPDGKAKDSSVMNASDKEYPIVTANHPLVSKIAEAYASKPEFMVKHGQWTPWRLYVATQEPRSTDAEWGKKMLTDKMFTGVAKDRDINPLGLAFEGLNAKVVSGLGDILLNEPETVDQEYKNILVALQGGNPHIAPQKTASLSETGIAFLGKVEQSKPRERITLQWDVWHLEKINKKIV